MTQFWPRCAAASFAALVIAGTLATAVDASTGRPEALSAPAVQRKPAPVLRFEVSYPAAANPGPITGRVFVMIVRKG